MSYIVPCSDDTSEFVVCIFFLVEELGEFGAEIKLSLFQLGLSPQIIASILMQVSINISP